MKIEDIRRYCGRYGVSVEAERDGQGRHYRMYIPVYQAGRAEPVRIREYLAAKPSDCVRYMDTLLADEEFKAASERWTGWKEERQ